MKNFNKRNIDEYNKFSSYLKLNKIKCIVHSSYTINLCKDWDEHSWWLKVLLLEINFAHYINAIGVVIHLGNQMDLEKTKAINNTYTSLVYVLSKIKNIDIQILLETSSGQGSEMFFDLNDFSLFYKKLKYKFPKIGICLDTCHVFSAGYNLKTKKDIIKFIDHFNKTIGLEHIKLIHLNDSKNDVGSKIDRHENFYKSLGYIGKKSIKFIFNFFKDINIPIILETPKDKIMKDFVYLKNL
jgi:deoxyribonuclease-4